MVCFCIVYFVHRTINLFWILKFWIRRLTGWRPRIETGHRLEYFPRALNTKHMWRFAEILLIIHLLIISVGCSFHCKTRGGAGGDKILFVYSFFVPCNVGKNGGFWRSYYKMPIKGETCADDLNRYASHVALSLLCLLFYRMIHWFLVRYVKLRIAHAPRMPGTFSPPPRVG